MDLAGISIRGPAGSEPRLYLALFQSFLTLARVQGLAGSALNKALLEEQNRPHQS